MPLSTCLLGTSAEGAEERPGSNVLFTCMHDSLTIWAGELKYVRCHLSGRVPSEPAVSCFSANSSSHIADNGILRVLMQTSTQARRYVSRQLPCRKRSRRCRPHLCLKSGLGQHKLFSSSFSNFVAGGAANSAKKPLKLLRSHLKRYHFEVLAQRRRGQEEAWREHTRTGKAKLFRGKDVGVTGDP